MRARSVTIKLTPEQKEQLRLAQDQAERELPELIELDRKLTQAAAEQTVSGALRRAVHAGPIDLAERAGITPEDLHGFLTGERALPSDALDRLAAEVGCQLVQPV